MNKALLEVTKFEFIRQVKKPSFWATILLIPLMVVAIFVIAAMTSSNTSNEAKFGEDTRVEITDDAGVLSQDVPMRTHYSREEGKKRVIAGETDLFFYIPADFKETRAIEMYHISEGLDLFNTDGEAVKNILVQDVAKKYDELDVMALTGQFVIQDNKLMANGEESNVLGKAVVPLTILVIFFFLVTLFGGRMLMTVVEEKENRISEMILTSVSAKHLIIGKILSMMLLGIIQILALVIPVIVALFIYKDNEMVAGVMSNIELDPMTIISNVILFIFSVFLVTGCLTYIGTITSTAKDASQFIGPVVIGVVFPLYFMSGFMAAVPNGLIYFLTYFPLSAPTALMLRGAFGTLTMTELVIGLVEIGVLSVIVIRATIRSFQKNALNFEFAIPKIFRIKK